MSEDNNSNSLSIDDIVRELDREETNIVTSKEIKKLNKPTTVSVECYQESYHPDRNHQSFSIQDLQVVIDSVPIYLYQLGYSCCRHPIFKMEFVNFHSSLSSLGPCIGSKFLFRILSMSD